MIARAKLSVEFGVPLRVASQARRRSVRHHLENAAHRISRAQHLIHLLLHARLDLPIHAAQRRIEIRAHRLDFAPTPPAVPVRTCPTATTWLKISQPNSRSSSLATAPSATRAAVSRAEARSKM